MFVFVFCQAEDGIRYLVRSRGLGDVYKRQTVEEVVRGLRSVGVSARDIISILQAIKSAGALAALSLIHI